ncbi:unnamed protein product [Phaeothamnion confervicola]
MALLGLLVGLFLSLARGVFGDLFRALGLGLFLVARRSGRLGAGYPVVPYLRPAARLAPRRPFPPGTDNPWQYRPEDVLAAAGRRPAPEFGMARCLLAAVFLGGIFGYLVGQVRCFGLLATLFPTFIMALAGAAAAAYGVTSRTAAGDLARVASQRAVATAGLVRQVDAEVRVAAKLGAASKLCLSTALFWDRKYRLKERTLTVLAAGYAKVAEAVGSVQRDMGDAGGGGRGGGGGEEEWEAAAASSSPPPPRDGAAGYGGQGERRRPPSPPPAATGGEPEDEFIW